MGIFARAFARGTSFGRAFVRSHATSRTTIEATKVFQSVARSSDRARRASTLTKILDGSVWHLEGRKGELVGEDALGNKLPRRLVSTGTKPVGGAPERGRLLRRERSSRMARMVAS